MFVGTGDRYVTIARSDLAAAISGALAGEVETVFGDTVEALRDNGRVHVTFRSGARREQSSDSRERCSEQGSRVRWALPHRESTVCPMSDESQALIAGPPLRTTL